MTDCCNPSLGNRSHMPCGEEIHKHFCAASSAAHPGAPQRHPLADTPRLGCAHAPRAGVPAPGRSAMAARGGGASWARLYHAAQRALERTGGASASPGRHAGRRPPGQRSAELCGAERPPPCAGVQPLFLPPAHWPGTALSDQQQHTLGYARRQFSPGAAENPAVEATGRRPRAAATCVGFHWLR